MSVAQQYQMIGGPYDGSLYPEPRKPSSSTEYYWQLEATGHFVIYRWEGFRWMFVRIQKERPAKP